MSDFLSLTSVHPILNIAHRGARSLAPENTLAAAHKALQAGAHMWELDVAMTADGELIIMHDNTLERTTNVNEVFPSRRPWRVHDFTFEEIRRLDCGSWFNEEDPFGQIAAGQVSADEASRYVGERAPTLREALEWTAEHKWLVNVEIKNLKGTPSHTKVAERVVSLAEELNITERVLISSFNHEYLERIRAVNDRIAIGVLVRSAPRDPLSLLRALRAQAYHPRVDAVRFHEIELLRMAGHEVFVWVANDEETIRALIGARVSGIFTDFPQVLKPILETFGQEPHKSPA